MYECEGEHDKMDSYVIWWLSYSYILSEHPHQNNIRGFFYISRVCSRTHIRACVNVALTLKALNFFMKILQTKAFF